MYEDICRECYLLKMISLLTSYPIPNEFFHSISLNQSGEVFPIKLKGERSETNSNE